jgi:hypothetical protein
MMVLLVVTKSQLVTKTVMRRRRLMMKTSTISVEAVASARWYDWTQT